MGAVVQRIVTSPIIKTEYLSLDHGRESQWSEKFLDAEIFPTYAKADHCASELRKFFAGDHCFVHAAVTDKKKTVADVPVAIRKTFDNAPADFVMPAPKPHTKKTREQRCKQREEEMKQDDLRQLEEIEAYE